MADLIVVGAGLAGLVAAYTAAKAGLRVKLIAKGLGALHWGAGTVDVLGYYPNASTPVERPFETVQALALARPRHPYALLEGTGLAESLQAFLVLTREIGLPYGGQGRKNPVPSPDGENLWLSSPLGVARPTLLAPWGQLVGDLHSSQPMLIVGFRGMRDFFPTLIADNLAKQGHQARAVSLPLDFVTERPYTNSVQLARELENPSHRSRLGTELRRLVQAGERIGLPAILGIDEHESVMEELQACVGAAIFEIPTLPPSVPGVRLSTALWRQLQRLGVDVERNMNVIGFHVEDRRLVWVETETSSRPIKHRADTFLLATGGVLGGGINTDHRGRAWEVVLDLPLALPAQRSGWLRPEFLGPQGHPIFSSGVPVDGHFQPVGTDGLPMYANLYAVGGLLAHADPIRERSMEGIAIGTAVSAIHSIVERQPRAAARHTTTH